MRHVYICSQVPAHDSSKTILAHILCLLANRILAVERIVLSFITPCVCRSISQVTLTDKIKISSLLAGSTRSTPMTSLS